jgi:hypothetical protein
MLRRSGTCSRSAGGLASDPKVAAWCSAAGATGSGTQLDEHVTSALAPSHVCAAACYPT